MTTSPFDSSSLTPEQWQALQVYLEAETGMDLSGPRVTRLEQAVARALSTNPDMPAGDRLFHDPDQLTPFLDRVVDGLTVGESFFFRNDQHIRALREDVLPDLIRANADRCELRVWSAGCATGEEPYSLAILLDEFALQLEDWQISILGTDLNSSFLERARQGLYRPWSFRQTDIHLDSRYFTAVRTGYQINPHLQKHVRFHDLNLVTDVFPSLLTGTVGLDLILFRNVSIYLKEEVTAAILSRFCQALRPEGWLLLGEAEVGLAPTEGFTVRRIGGSTFFQRDASSCADNSAPARPPRPVLSELPLPTSQLPEWARIPEWVQLPQPKQISSPAVDSVEQQVRRFVQSGDLAAARLAIHSEESSVARSRLRMILVRGLLDHADMPGVREQLEICLRENPLLLEAHLLRGTLGEESGDLQEAEASYRRVLYLDRHCCIAHFQLALTLQARGDHAAARKSLETVYEMASRQPPGELVEYGDGVCYGRLAEMARLLRFGELA